MLPCLALLSACADPFAVPEPAATAVSPIIGGSLDASRDHVVGVGGDSGPFCTGTVISRRVVITAGHCLAPGEGKQGGITRVYFGADLRAGADPPPVAIETLQGMRHPDFSAETLRFDLALVQLAADAPAQPAPLLRETMAISPAWIGPDFTFVGYGNDGAGDSGLRRAASFPIFAVGPAEVGLDTGTGPIDETMFYYRPTRQNTCEGDSGGPAFVARGGALRLAGISSYGDGPCLVDGVSARVDAPVIAAWIQPAIDALEDNHPCRNDGVCNEGCNAGDRHVDPDCTASRDSEGDEGGCATSPSRSGDRWTAMALLAAIALLPRRRA